MATILTTLLVEAFIVAFVVAGLWRAGKKVKITLVDKD